MSSKFKIMDEPIVIALFVAAIFTLAGFVKGVVGMGLPTVAMGILGLIMAPVAAASILIFPSLITNVWQLLTGPKLGILLRRLTPMLIMVCIGTAIGIRVLTGASSLIASAMLGIILTIYGVIGLTARQFIVSPRLEPWLSPVVGISTGLITGATGIFVVPAVPYIGSIGLDKEELIQALGISFTVSTIALAIALALTGKYQMTSVGTSILAVLPALAGMHVGQKIREKLNPIAFKRWFFIGLIILGIYMSAKALLMQ